MKQWWNGSSQGETEKNTLGQKKTAPVLLRQTTNLA
jgi:hypothetical protein